MSVLTNGYRFLLDETTKSSSVRLQNLSQPWIVDANAVWTNNRIKRYTLGFVRLPTPWRQTYVVFDAICTSSAFGSLTVSIVVDGAQAATQVLTGDARTHTYTVTGLPIKADGTSVVELWEMWSGNGGAQNTGVDKPMDGGWITAVNIPIGTVITRATSNTGIVVVGDSVIASVGVTASQATLGYFGSVAGQIQLSAEARGWLSFLLAYGGSCLCGDGLTAANWITIINQAVAAMGNPATVKVLINPFRNDYSNCGAGVNTIPSQGQTFLTTLLSGLPSAYQKIVVTAFNQTGEGAVGGFTLPNWRTATIAAAAAVPGTTVVDGTANGVGAGGRSDGIHFNASGVALAAPAVLASLGL